MFKKKCFIKILLCSILIVCTFNTNVYATNIIVVDTSNVYDGYILIYYSTSNLAKIKIGIALDDQVVYYDYDIGTTACYAFTKGDGLYTISIYQNIKDDLYKRIFYKKVYVELENKLSPYLISTYEVNFSKDDDVSKKASEICKLKFMPLVKVCTIHDYVYKNIAYDYDLAANIKSGKIKSYHPKAIDILKNKKGICYDKAVLFAAMCCSQDIPCEIVKGYYKDIPHAWNKVYIKDKWIYIDPSTKIDFSRNNGKYYKEKI